ncbi:ExbD/TolR family protein [Thauera mechernichensis]|uniref:ExbD/TolR family protein n=1 Tax=Thauera mechernichensis TaxID=82788 RepID=A0ABW3WFI4_9RHOO|nr:MULTISPECIES: biopolymer transporter ExbD [Thauera]ENO81373.1 ExbD protein [Thauera sp. 27]MDG3064985.1 biopolymer transporter ExbD [Thauera mechernichensis]
MAFGNGLEDTGDTEMSEINMIPLVDIMLVLLIIFIITVPVMTHSVKLDLPRAANQPNVVEPRTVTIAVTAAGGLHWNEDRIDYETLEARLIQIASEEPQPEIHVRGDRSVEYEQVVKVMAAAQRAGMQKLGFVTDPQP